MLIIPRLLMLLCCTLFLSHIGHADEHTTVIPPGSFQGTGGNIYLENPGISVSTIAGWKGNHHPDAGITLKMEGPVETIPSVHTTLLFRPNFSIRTIRQTAAIDRIRLTAFVKELTHQFTHVAPLVKFKIESAKIVSYTPSSQAIKVTASYYSKSQRLIQTHLLVAARHHQYVLTFTDLHALLLKHPHRQARINHIVSSLKVAGDPPPRYRLLKSIAPLSAVMTLLLALISLLKDLRRKLKLRRLIRTLARRAKGGTGGTHRHHGQPPARSGHRRQPKTQPLQRPVRPPAPIGLNQQTFQTILAGSPPWPDDQASSKHSVDIPVLNL